MFENSLFRCVGNSAASHWIRAPIRHECRGGWPDSAKFPVNFPVSREFGAETSSQLTASSATQSVSRKCAARANRHSMGWEPGSSKTPPSFAERSCLS